MDHLLAARIKSMQPSATFAIHKKAQLLRAEGHDVIDLSIGEPSEPPSLVIQQAAKEAIDSGKYFGYSPVAGYKDLREAIATKLAKENGIHVTPEQVIASTGAKMALVNTFLCLLDPGDEVIIFSPHWVSYAATVALAGGKPVFVKGNKIHNFEPSLEQVAKAITPKTKAILFSSPSNPTGLVLSRSYLESLASLLLQYPTIMVVADEIYEYINFTDEFTSIGSLASLQGRVVTVNGFSKGYAMTGWRVGYLAAPLWLAQACEKLQGQLTAGTCSIAQRAALSAFSVDPADMAQVRATYERRRDLLLGYIQNIPGIYCNVPQGAFYLFPDVSHYFGYTKESFVIKNVEDFCLYILQEAKVTLVPGTSFGDANCIRISYSSADEAIKKGLERIQEALGQLHPAGCGC
jgi:aspartate aminotransferase